MRYLFASTCSVYYAPTTADEANVTAMTEDMPIAPTANYSKTKRLAEVELLRIADQNPLFVPVLLRKGTIFGLGPRMRFDLVVNVFTLHAWKNQQLTVHGHGEAWRPLLHIRDACRRLYPSPLRAGRQDSRRGLQPRPQELPGPRAGALGRRGDRAAATASRSASSATARPTPALGPITSAARRSSSTLGFSAGPGRHRGRRRHLGCAGAR